MPGTPFSALMGHYTAAPEDNLLGITNKQRLNEEEARGVIRAEAYLLELELPVELTTDLLLEIHRVAFGHLYDWTGQWRRSNPSVGEADTLLPYLKRQTIGRKDYLLTEGQVCGANYFVLRGFLRTYLLNEKGLRPDHKRRNCF